MYSGLGNWPSIRSKTSFIGTSGKFLVCLQVWFLSARNLLLSYVWVQDLHPLSLCETCHICFSKAC